MRWPCPRRDHDHNFHLMMLSDRISITSSGQDQHHLFPQPEQFEAFEAPNDRQESNPMPQKGQSDDTHNARSVRHDPLYPPHPEEIESSLSLTVPSTEDEYTRIIENQCGVADDSQPVEQYDGTLGVDINFVNARQGPAGQLQWNNNLATIYTDPGNVSGARFCSGTLISPDLWLTAGHCFKEGGGWRFPRVNGTTD